MARLVHVSMLECASHFCTPHTNGKLPKCDIPHIHLTIALLGITSGLRQQMLCNMRISTARIPCYDCRAVFSVRYKWFFYSKTTKLFWTDCQPITAWNINTNRNTAPGLEDAMEHPLGDCKHRHTNPASSSIIILHTITEEGTARDWLFCIILVFWPDPSTVIAEKLIFSEVLNKIMISCVNILGVPSLEYHQ